MAMPETSMEKYHLSSRAEDQIGAAWQLLLVELVSVALRMKQAADTHLKGGVLAFHRLHRSPSDFGRFH